MPILIAPNMESDMETNYRKARNSMVLIRCMFPPNYRQNTSWISFFPAVVLVCLFRKL